MAATSSVAAGNNDVLIPDSLCKVCLFSSLASPSLDVGQISSLFPVFQDFVIMCLAGSMHCVLYVCSPAELGTLCLDESALVAMPSMANSVASTQACASPLNGQWSYASGFFPRTFSLACRHHHLASLHGWPSCVLVF